MQQGCVLRWSVLERAHTLGQVALPQSAWQEHIGKRDFRGLGEQGGSRLDGVWIHGVMGNASLLAPVL